MVFPNKPAAEPHHVAIACHASYEDDFGGSFRLASEFAEFLASRGHQVTFVCCAPQGKRSLPQQEVVRHVAIRRYRPPGEWMPQIARLRYHIHARQAAASAKPRLREQSTCSLATLRCSFSGPPGSFGSDRFSKPLSCIRRSTTNFWRMPLDARAGCSEPELVLENGSTVAALLSQTACADRLPLYPEVDDRKAWGCRSYQRSRRPGLGRCRPVSTNPGPNGSSRSIGRPLEHGPTDFLYTQAT